VLAANARQHEDARQHLGAFVHETEAVRVRREQRLVEADVLADDAEQLQGRVARRRDPQMDGRVVVQLEEPPQSAAVVVMVVGDDRRIDRGNVDRQVRALRRMRPRHPCRREPPPVNVDAERQAPFGTSRGSSGLERFSTRVVILKMSSSARVQNSAVG